MGQKTHPYGFRLGITREWLSNWYDERNFAAKLNEDLMLRKYLNKRLSSAGIAKIEIERTSKAISITIHTSRPGVVIGAKGKEVDQLREEIRKLTQFDVNVNVVEIKKPELNAYLVGENIAQQLVKKMPFRRVLKRSIQNTMRQGAEGIRIQLSGRLGGAEMARQETMREGRVPLHTLRSDIDYADVTAFTTYGCIGIKVWICNGEVSTI
ncbi:MAG: 30S ribosomal protein S3 [Candidatus Marinimicrobia bacterium]|nr:30S ribosomal protein S3 [Candidatus Neomarinimicrobiota bacterium]MDD4960688.1 30S ribosomal protein S3 [Candidatus Neomarinimicrobiota bacterium]MDD5709193.1 30S ribosomal protein S3 [Candidatus Neomarinimicrobiota bacterium]MDX9778270.1 30S ribosomal protein S3 [bacterium]